MTEAMTGAIIEDIKQQLPKIVADTLRHEISILMETFASHDEVSEATRRQIDGDTALRQELAKTSTELNAAQQEIAHLRGRMEALEKTASSNAADIKQMRQLLQTAQELFQATTGSIQSNVATIQTSIASGMADMRALVAALGDRVSSQSKRLDSKAQRLAALEDHDDQQAAAINANAVIIEDLSTRMLPVRDYIFGGSGHIGIPAQFDKLNEMVGVLHAEAVTRQERKKVYDDQIATLKAIFKGAFEGRKLAIGAIGGTGIAVFLSALAENPAAQALFTVIQGLFGG